MACCSNLLRLTTACSLTAVNRLSGGEWAKVAYAIIVNVNACTPSKTQTGPGRLKYMQSSTSVHCTCMLPCVRSHMQQLLWQKKATHAEGQFVCKATDMLLIRMMKQSPLCKHTCGVNWSTHLTACAADASSKALPGWCFRLANAHSTLDKD